VLCAEVLQAETLLQALLVLQEQVLQAGLLRTDLRSHLCRSCRLC
jgi:hypothetical protein